MMMECYDIKGGNFGGIHQSRMLPIMDMGGSEDVRCFSARLIYHSIVRIGLGDAHGIDAFT